MNAARCHGSNSFVLERTHRQYAHVLGLVTRHEFAVSLCRPFAKSAGT
jgi:hypothetical protein